MTYASPLRGESSDPASLVMERLSQARWTASRRPNKTRIWGRKRGRRGGQDKRRCAHLWANPLSAHRFRYNLFQPQFSSWVFYSQSKARDSFFIGSTNFIFWGKADV